MRARQEESADSGDLHQRRHWTHQLLGDHARIEDIGGQPDKSAIEDEAAQSRGQQRKGDTARFAEDERKAGIAGFCFGRVYAGAPPKSQHEQEQKTGQPEGDAPISAAGDQADQRPGHDRAEDVAEGHDGGHAFDLPALEPFRQDAKHRRPAAGLRDAVEAPEQEHEEERGLKGEGDIDEGDDQQAEADHAEGADVAADLPADEMADAVDPEEDGAQSADFSAADIQVEGEQGQDDAEIHTPQIEAGVGNPDGAHHYVLRLAEGAPHCAHLRVLLSWSRRLTIINLNGAIA